MGTFKSLFFSISSNFSTSFFCHSIFFFHLGSSLSFFFFLLFALGGIFYIASSNVLESFEVAFVWISSFSTASLSAAVSLTVSSLCTTCGSSLLFRFIAPLGQSFLLCLHVAHLWHRGKRPFRITFNSLPSSSSMLSEIFVLFCLFLSELSLPLHTHKSWRFSSPQQIANSNPLLYHSILLPESILTSPRVWQHQQ